MTGETPNPLDWMRRAYEESVQHAHLCNGLCPDADDEAVRDPDCLGCHMLDALAQVAALAEAAQALLSDDDIPNHWDDCVVPFAAHNKDTNHA